MYMTSCRIKNANGLLVIIKIHVNLVHVNFLLNELHRNNKKKKFKCQNNDKKDINVNSVKNLR